jgi:cyclophilin family peptidyl-prolyl cis-trans isomerase
LYGTGKTNPQGDLTVNETASGIRLSNTRGTAAIAHFDVPDCGNTEVFINLQANSHLDAAYGGFCVFAKVDDNDAQSFQTIDAIAQAVKTQGKVGIRKAIVQ